MPDFDLSDVIIPEHLQQALWAAYDALTEKRAQVDKIKAARAVVEHEITADQAQLDAAKTAYIAGFTESVSGEDGDPEAPQRARATMAEIGGRIYAAQQTLPDFALAIRKAEADMEPLDRAYTKARGAVVKTLRRRIPKDGVPPGDLISLADMINGTGVINLRTVMTLYLSVFDSGPSEMGLPFAPHQGTMRFFSFLANFFREPSREELAQFSQDFEALLWGERAPGAKVPMPVQPPPDAYASSFDFSGKR